MPRSSKQVQPKLLALLREGRSRHSASHSAGIHPTTFYRWLKADDDFRRAVQSAEASPPITSPPDAP